MFVSTKGRYALRVMITLAQLGNEEYHSLAKIAELQNISLKYLESIVVILSKAGMIEGVRGKGGGYRLNRKPEEYKVSEIITLAEGGIAPVSCLNGEENTCERQGDCVTLPLWKKLDKVINDYLDSVTLYDLINNLV